VGWVGEAPAPEEEEEEEGGDLSFHICSVMATDSRGVGGAPFQSYDNDAMMAHGRLERGGRARRRVEGGRKNQGVERPAFRELSTERLPKVAPRAQ
jgi:hypothetical protein